MNKNLTFVITGCTNLKKEGVKFVFVGDKDHPTLTQHGRPMRSDVADVFAKLLPDIKRIHENGGSPVVRIVSTTKT